MEDLWDIIAAKGFEKDMFFEQAAMEIKGMPKLEGTKHVNMALIAKLIPNYMFNPKEYPEVGRMNGNGNDDFLFNQGPTKGYGKIQFHDYMPVFNSVSHLSNVKIFIEQVKAFQEVLMVSGAGIMNQMMNFDFLFAMGEIFSVIPYAQLIVEAAKMEGVQDEIINGIFDVFVRDMSNYATTFLMKPSTTDQQIESAKKIIRKPVTDAAEFDKVINDHIYTLIDAYTMNP
jgi:acyl-CoA dehydrogenase